MNQPWVFMCSPSQSPLPPPSPPDPSRSSQCTRSERLSHASNLGCHRFLFKVTFLPKTKIFPSRNRLVSLVTEIFTFSLRTFLPYFGHEVLEIFHSHSLSSLGASKVNNLSLNSVYKEERNYAVVKIV